MEARTYAHRARGAAVGTALAAIGLAAAALATTGCVVGRPGWVAPGVRLLYRADGAARSGIRFLIAREGNEIAVTRGAGAAAPAYEPNSGWVYYAFQGGESWDLYRVRLSGEDRVPLTATSHANERWPVPGPDGATLYFTSDESGTDQIYRSNLEAGDARILTSGSLPHSRAVPDSAGSTLVAVEGEGDAARLVRIDAQSGAVTSIGTGSGTPPLGRPAVRADGAVVFGCRGPKGGDICLAEPSGKVRRLTDDDADDREPIWSPDGRAVVFSSNREKGNFELYAMRSDGSKVRRLTDEPGPDGEPFWVP